MSGRPLIATWDRFWEKIEVGHPAGCWWWTASLNGAGYGQFGVGPVGSRKMHKAHRVAWQWLVGPVPVGMQLDHLCRNRRCCNPDHMEIVTHQENIARGYGASARNARKSRCTAGHRYDAANTRITSNGYRICRACHRARERNRRTARRITA